MSVDFSVQNAIEMLGQVAFNGDTQLAGLAVMVAVFFIAVLILAGIHAPITYSVVILIPISIMFIAMGIVSTELGVIITIIASLITAREASRMILG